MIRPSQFAAEMGELDVRLMDAPDELTRLRRMTDALLRAHPDLAAEEADDLVRWWHGTPRTPELDAAG
jgi:gamma-glutamyl:cysteine ligase YbdK (ATP-grasp superfamily)